MGDWRNWTGPESPWLQEGYFVSYVRDTVRYYEHIRDRDLAHYEYEWSETIASLSESGPYVPEDLVPTQGYDSENATNQIWQVIFGIEGQVYIYIELPTDTHRHGVPKVPKPRRELREVSHFEEWMSPFKEPSFLTEHIMMKPGYDRVNISAYNPQDISVTPRLNFFIAKLVTERIGTEQYGVLNTPVIPDNPSRTDQLKARWMETLEKLYRRQIPHRPLTLKPVWAPETE
jgi:hypothetical protein